MFALIRTNILKRSTLWRALNTRWKNIGEQLARIGGEGRRRSCKYDSTLASEAVARKRESTAEQEETSADNAELPAHLEAMTKTLKTPENCFQAFAPLLHIMLATDPLNWNATFSKRSTTKDSNLEDRS
ncbi:hypothetical protein GQ600_25876 [Phytophthora cactorum]|nr:hypothetical protein GQ600_25876 [Phytophthora cactorum]